LVEKLGEQATQNTLAEFAGDGLIGVLAYLAGSSGSAGNADVLTTERIRELERQERAYSRCMRTLDPSWTSAGPSEGLARLARADGLQAEPSDSSRRLSLNSLEVTSVSTQSA